MGEKRVESLADLGVLVAVLAAEVAALRGDVARLTKTVGDFLLDEAEAPWDGGSSPAPNPHGVPATEVRVTEVGSYAAFYGSLKADAGPAEGYSPLTRAAVWLETVEQMDRARWQQLREAAPPGDGDLTLTLTDPDREMVEREPDPPPPAPPRDLAATLERMLAYVPSGEDEFASALRCWAGQLALPERSALHLGGWLLKALGPSPSGWRRDVLDVWEGREPAPRAML